MRYVPIAGPGIGPERYIPHTYGRRHTDAVPAPSSRPSKPSVKPKPTQSQSDAANPRRHRGQGQGRQVRMSPQFFAIQNFKNVSLRQVQAIQGPLPQAVLHSHRQSVHRHLVQGHQAVHESHRHRHPVQGRQAVQDRRNRKRSRL